MERPALVRVLRDANIVLEILLQRNRAAECRALLARPDEHEFFLSDFSLHTVGVILFRHGRRVLFRQFIDDMILNGAVVVAALYAGELQPVNDFAQQFNLDFDDAYQCAVAEKFDLTIVSFDADFDRAARGRRTPAELLSPPADATGDPA